MSETNNPFEQAMNMPANAPIPQGGTVPDPFGITSQPAPVTAPQENTFGEKPLAPAAPLADLGSQPVANPFETPEATPAETQIVAPQAAADQTGTQQEVAKQVAPIIDIGNQASAASPFTETELSNASVKEIGGAQLTVLKPLSEDEAQPEDEEIANPLAAAINELDKAEQQSIFAKPPVFEHGAVKEPIEDLTQTFEDLRVAKADDFPELEDGIRVSWSVTYGKIVKSVPTPKKTAIGEFKKSIESSKEFVDALKKDKNKSPDCIIKPKITAQSKGDKMPLPLYKGVFTNIEDARASGKVITIVPGSDGRVYEIRNEEMGMFATPIDECRGLSDIQAGFTPALPLIPRGVLHDIICFFRSLLADGKNYEAIANIYWDRSRESFIAVIPKQRVTSVKAESELSDEYPPEQYLHYMDVHSHNVMPARFSTQDDRDEKATRLYAVIGKLNNPTPDMSVRISNGGKHLLIDPATVFDASGEYRSATWDGQDVRDPDIGKLAKMIIMAFSRPHSEAAQLTSLCSMDSTLSVQEVNL
jgi:hypothetical protein